jgi:soluble lytic murein transglycosylase
MLLPKPLCSALLAIACVLPATAQTPEAGDDDTFLLLREAARQDDAAKTNALASRLPNYSIPSYVEYYRLKPRLRDAPADEIRDFLTRYKGSAIADRLRNDWLLELGRARDWTNFDQQLPLFVLNDDTQVKCYALLSRLAHGQKVADDARALLVNPPTYGEACTALVASLAAAGQFDSNDWPSCAWPASCTRPGRRAAPRCCWARPTRARPRPSTSPRWRWRAASAPTASSTKSTSWRSAAWRAPASNWPASPSTRTRRS